MGAIMTARDSTPTATGACPELAEGVLSVTLPVPGRVLSPNGRAHWLAKANAAKALRYAALQLTREAMEATGCHWWEWRPWPAARMNVHYRFAGTPMDSDNLIAALKPARDGATDAGLVDNDRVIEIGTITTERVKRFQQEVALTFERLEQP